MAISKESSNGLFNSSSGNDCINKLIIHVQENLEDNQFGVDSLAKKVGMSRSSLHRKLKKYLGKSTSQFIREYRLERALEILGQEDITASETAYRVGFSSPTYFNTCFNKFYGFTPGEVKSQNQDEIDTIINGKVASNEKHHKAKKLLWVGLVFAIIAAIIVLYYSKSPVDNNAFESDSITVNEKSIAVLPLKNWTGNPDLEYLSDGMTDAIISGLAKINSIDKLTPFSTILTYKNTGKTPREIAAELGVAKLVQGNLQISGNQIKVNLQLIDANSNEHVWSEGFTRKWHSDEIFKIQAEVVEGVAGNIHAVITKEELVDIKKPLTNSKEAYTFYLQAEFQRNQASAKAYENAIPLYQKAIVLDSNFMMAHVGLANTWIFGGLVWGIFNEQEAWANAKKSLERALSLDSTNQKIEGELHSGYFYYDWNFERVEPYYQKSLKGLFTDANPPINYDYAVKTGRYEQAIAYLNKYIAANPTDGISFNAQAEALMLLDRTDEILPILNRSDSLYGDNFWYLRETAKLYFYLGQYKRSKALLNKMLTNFQDYPPILMWLNAVYSEMDGKPEKTAKHLAELHQKYNEGSSGSPAWFIALFYCTRNDYENTFIWLEKSYERHEVEMTWLREEPLLAPVREDPRYEILYRKVGFSDIGLPIKSPSKKTSS